MADPLAALIVVIDFDGVPQDEWDEWYDTEHLPERRALPGFLTGDRWRAADGGAQSLALYDMQSVQALRTDAYLALRGENASPWTKRIHRLRHADERPSHRYECRQLRPGRLTAPSTAGFVHLMRAHVGPDGEAAFLAVADAEAERIADLPGVACVRWFEALNHDSRIHRFLRTVHLDEPNGPALAVLDAPASIGRPGVLVETGLYALAGR